jgi:D-sedoheptulose 7-phosphate isomerase
MKDKISARIAQSIEVKQNILNNEELLGVVNKSVSIIVDAFNQGKKVLFCGNGGSAADAQHLAAEFSGRFYKNRKALPAEALHCNTSYLTAVANDYGFDLVYSRLIEGIAVQGDVLIVLSTSGNSTNIINAVHTAKQIGVEVIGFTGASGGALRSIVNHLIDVPSTDTPRIQESHILIGHIICELVEAQLFLN